MSKNKPEEKLVPGTNLTMKKFKEFAAKEETRVKALNKAIEDDEKEDIRRKVEAMSLKERLMRRVYVRQFETIVKDDVGEFIIYTRSMTGEEQDKAVSAVAKLMQATDLRNFEAQTEAYQDMREILKEIIVDTSLIELIDSKILGNDIVQQTLINTMVGMSNEIETQPTNTAVNFTEKAPKDN